MLVANENRVQQLLQLNYKQRKTTVDLNNILSEVIAFLNEHFKGFTKGLEVTANFINDDSIEESLARANTIHKYLFSLDVRKLSDS